MLQSVKFNNKIGLTLRGFIHTPKQYDTAIIFLHGFPSTCQGFTAERMAQVISKLPYLFLTFSFSGSPPSAGKFEDKLMSQEVADIRSAIDFLKKEYSFTQLVLIGHSTGAIDASLYAYKDKRISKLILMGAESDTRHSVRYDFTDQQVHDFWNKGYIKYHRPGHWVHQQRLRKAFYDEFFTLNIPAAIQKYRRPLLIIHGEKDEAVPLGDARELYRFARKPKKLVVIKGADHRFSKTKHFRKLLKTIQTFIEKK